ncbi:MAG TPA: MmpS family transport accessory protein [Mycobacterium sp.]|jgi:hypothetical protein|uniref:MmpS family transport accessory protein n=1 Tax=Mycobacterium sp. TaxID=1785 RepID=UPI002F3E4EB7
MTFAGVLKRAWIPPRVRAGFGSETHAYPNSKLTDTRQFHPRSVVYEVFGPVGTVADISYFDVNWRSAASRRVPAVVGNVVAQGDTNSIGCRIVVDGQVKAERISNEVNAYTHCLARGA